MIVGVGVDVVDLARFERAVERTPALVTRLFAENERGLALRSLAARFAAKEALLKALGESTGVKWHDMEIVNDAHGSPSFLLSAGAAAIAHRRGVTRVHLSLTHDGPVATAFVIAERVEAS
jgi:holo-[acyl-carrier protein] synthase